MWITKQDADLNRYISILFQNLIRPTDDDSVIGSKYNHLNLRPVY